MVERRICPFCFCLVSPKYTSTCVKKRDLHDATKISSMMYLKTNLTNCFIYHYTMKISSAACLTIPSSTEPALEYLQI